MVGVAGGGGPNRHQRWYQRMAAALGNKRGDTDSAGPGEKFGERDGIGAGDAGGTDQRAGDCARGAGVGDAERGGVRECDGAAGRPGHPQQPKGRLSRPPVVTGPAASVQQHAVAVGGGQVLQAGQDIHYYEAVSAVAAEVVSVAAPVGRLVSEVRGRARLIDTVAGVVREGSGRVVVLNGAGGYGKTTVALRVVKEVADTVTVWWVDATSTAGVMRGLAEVALQAGANAQRVAAAWYGQGSAPDVLWAALHAVAERWVLVFDNADDPRVLAASGGRVLDGTGWLRTPPAGRGTVIVTTRDRGPTTWGNNAVHYPVRSLDPVDGGKVLRDFAPSAGDATQAEALSVRLGGLPLALHAAGSYLTATSRTPGLPGLTAARSFADYTVAWEELTVVPSVGIEVAERETVSRTWELSLDLLAARGHPLARRLLRLLACLGPAPVPHFLLDASVLAGSPLFEAITAPQVADLLAALDDLGLLDADIPSVGEHFESLTDAETLGVRLHPVIRETNRHQPDLIENRAAYTALCLGLLDQATTDLDGRDPSSGRRWWSLLALITHAETWTFTPPTMGQTDPTSSVAATLATVEHRAADFCSAAGLHSQALWLYYYALGHRIRTLGVEHPDTDSTRQNLFLVQKRGVPDDAEAAYRDILTIIRRVRGAEHPDALITRDPLAGLLRAQGALAVLNKHDPEGLLDLGAPKDEYQPEAADFARRLGTGQPITPDVVIEMWERWFGPGSSYVRNATTAELDEVAAELDALR